MWVGVFVGLEVAVVVGVLVGSGGVVAVGPSIGAGCGVTVAVGVGGAEVHASMKTITAGMNTTRLR